MIRNLIPAFILLLLITACSKDSVEPDSPINEDGKQLLSLSVDGFSQNLVPFVDRIQASNLNASLFSNTPLSSGTNLSDHINTLEFKVFYKGDLIDTYRQTSDDPDFGKYENYFFPTASIPYNVFITGAMLDNEGDIELKKSTDKITETGLRVLPEPADAFFFFNSYTVGAEPKTESIQLKRFVGRLEIDLMEEIPFDAHRLEVTIHNTAQYFMPVSEEGYHLIPGKDDSTPHNTSKTFIFKSEDIGRSDYSINMYFVLRSKLGSQAEISTITIKAFDITTKEIAVREINNVTLQANKRTKLSGIIFNHHPNMQFEVEINSEWDSEVPEYSF